MAAITFADVLTDQRVAEELNGEYFRIAANRDALPSHPALRYAGDFYGLGTLSRKVPYLGVDGHDLPAAYAEGVSVVDSVIADTTISLSVSRYSRAHAATDIVRYTDTLGVFNAGAFAQRAVTDHVLRLTDLIANLVDGFSNSITTTGVDLSIATVAAALILLETGAKQAISEGQAMAVLHTQQMGDFRTALITAAGGALQYAVPEERLKLMGTGYQGRFLGIDWFANGMVPTANASADRAGGIFLNGAILWSDMSQVADGADSAVIGNKILFERERTARSATSAYISHSYLGASLGLDSSVLGHQLGVSVISDA